ncbi:hypothetical protein ABZX85_17410 [Streptomyces sp. NPDC004539]|uniref:hypothetical protein n=1 Tax=Streptomyces sp. NPDC004539 TaxID=3154280 RepID=UPI0033B85A86
MFGTVLAQLPEVDAEADRSTEIVCMRQQQWLLLNWLAGVNESIPGDIEKETVTWVRRQVGPAAARECEAHAWVLGHPTGPVDTVVQDRNRVVRITAWSRLLAAVTCLHGDGTSAWLRRFDPSDMVEESTLAWLTGCEPPGWDPLAWPPDPRTLPEIRRKLMKFVDHPESRAEATAFLGICGLSMGPAPHGNPAAGDILADQEVQRLSKARLYFVDGDMCSVALRKATRPRATPLSAHRVPSPNGLLFFSDPVSLATPGQSDVVAAAWGLWDPDSHPDGWVRLNDADTYEPVGFAAGPHWWISLYHVQDSVMEDERDTPPLDLSDTHVVSEGQVFAPPSDAYSSQHAARVLIACWDLITQEQIGKPITDTALLTRKPTKTRADRRRGIEDDGTVRLVTVRGRAPQPSGEAGNSAVVPAQGSSIQYKHRWTVQEHSRSHCMNPRSHADSSCTHEDITILEFVKGPADAPFLRRDIVHILRKLDR